MACYKCGGEGGNEAKLCAKCTEERLSAKAAQKAAEDAPISADAMDNPWDRLEFLLSLPVVRGLMAALTLLVAIYFFMYSRIGPGLGYSKSERAYFRCVEKLRGGLRELPMGSLKPRQDEPFIRELAGGIASLTGDSLDRLVPELCTKVKEDCEKRKDSELCGIF